MKSIKSNQVLLVIIIILLLVLALFPIYWMITSSFKVENEIFSAPPTWFPKHFSLEHYAELFSQFQFGRHLINTAVIAMGTTIISVLLAFPAAYGLSRFKFPGVTLFIIAMMMGRVFTPASLITPFYDMMKALGLIDSLLAIVICVTVINVPFVLWIMKVFFDDFPRGLEEAALIDGCTYFNSFIRVVLPVALPAIATCILVSFTMGWNDLLFGLTLSQSIKSAPATVAISSMTTGQRTYWGAMMSGGTISSIPVIILTLVLLRYYIRGLTMGAIKE